MLTYRRDLTRQVNVSRNVGYALLQRALLVDVLHLLAQVLAAVDQADGAELDRQHRVRVLLDLLGEVARRLDGQGVPTASCG